MTSHIPSVFVQSFVHHENALIGCQDVCPAPLQHRNVCAVFMIVLGNIMATVSGTHDNYLFPTNITLRCITVLATMINIALEGLLSWERWHPSLARVSCTPHNVARAYNSL